MKPLMLVVEDELLIRMDFVELAQQEGFKTVEAGTADAAIDLLEQHSDVAVVFTDIKMPGSMNGVELAHVIRQKWPSKIIVVCSGNEPPIPDLPSGATFTPKPCTGPTVRDLLSDIREQAANTLP
jgi:two-component system, response regulator PdtaR